MLAKGPNFSGLASAAIRGTPARALTVSRAFALVAIAACGNATHDVRGAGGAPSSIAGATGAAGALSGGAGGGGASPSGSAGSASGAPATATAGARGSAEGGSAEGGRTTAPGGGAGRTESAGAAAETGGRGSHAGGAAPSMGGTPHETSGAGGASSGSGGFTQAVGPAVTKDGEALVTSDGLTIVSYGGYLNGESFQEDGIVSYGGYQYAAFWNTAHHVVVARRTLPAGAWSSIELTDYTNTAGDAHNTISLGVSPGDGTLHLAFDHHGDDLHYRRSAIGLLSTPAAATWTASSFGAVTSALVGSTKVSEVTYPRFVTEPGGNQMLFDTRIGSSGSGDEYLWEYDAASHAWKSLGKYLDGISSSVNAYLHGLMYSPGGTRLHAAWCWRETPDAQTNHDLFYAYSDDNGRNWKDDGGNVVAVTGSRFVTKDTVSARVWEIKQNRGLINQEHMIVDASGVVHVLLSHMPDSEADDSDFTRSRTKSQFFHYFRASDGSWHRVPIGLPVIENFRGKLAVSSTQNVYAILPDLRIAAASAAKNYQDWTLLDRTDSGRFFSDPLIDTARLLSEDKLTIYYPQKSSSNIYVLDYSIQ
jgi:hypothetical protein